MWRLGRVNLACQVKMRYIPVMNIQFVPIDDVKPNPHNPRTISVDALEKLTASVKSAPWMLKLRPLVVDDGLRVLGGNMRLRAASGAGLKMVPILLASELTLEQQKEFIAKDNIQAGEWDWEMVHQGWDVEQLESWGLEVMPLPEITDAGETQEDGYDDSTDAIETDIQLGDLIEMGGHRLVCGDSTNPDHVGLLLGGVKPRLMVTDPPYGVRYEANWRKRAYESEGNPVGKASFGKVKNDDISDWSEAWSLSPASVAYVWHSSKTAVLSFESLEQNNFIPRAQIIWAKDQAIISRGDYHWQHESCWYAVKKNETAKWCGDRKQTTLWQVPRLRKTDNDHSTQKPVECMGRPIRNHKGDVYDPFIGSGTTMIAAHQLERKCYGMEISPKYCQVVINRMLKQDPDVVILRNGRQRDIDR